MCVRGRGVDGVGEGGRVWGRSSRSACASDGTCALSSPQLATAGSGDPKQLTLNTWPFNWAKHTTLKDGSQSS